MTREKHNSQKRESTRNKILSAAVELFASKGLAATSAKDIASLAKVSVGLMYHYYKTKEEVFGALTKEAIREMRELKAMLKAESCPQKGLEGLVLEILNELKSSLEFSQWMVLLSHPLPAKHDPAWAEDFVGFHIQFVEQITELIIRGQREDKIVDDDPKMLAQFLLASIQGLCILQLSLKEAFVVPTLNAIIDPIIKSPKCKCA